MSIVSESDLASAVRKLTGYSMGAYNPEYIHMTRQEATAIVNALTAMADQP